MYAPLIEFWVCSCLEWNLYLTECLERHSKKVERNKQRDKERGWGERGRVKEIHKMGSVTTVSNENQSGKTRRAAQQGGWARGRGLGHGDT